MTIEFGTYVWSSVNLKPLIVDLLSFKNDRERIILRRDVRSFNSLLLTIMVFISINSILEIENLIPFLVR